MSVAIRWGLKQVGSFLILAFFSKCKHDWAGWTYYGFGLHRQKHCKKCFTTIREDL